MKGRDHMHLTIAISSMLRLTLFVQRFALIPVILFAFCVLLPELIAQMPVVL